MTQLMRSDLTPPPHYAPDILGMKVTGFGTASFEGCEIDVPIELSEMTPDAVFGADARSCSAETCAKLVEALTKFGARFVRRYAEKTQ